MDFLVVCRCLISYDALVGKSITTAEAGILHLYTSFVKYDWLLEQAMLVGRRVNLTQTKLGGLLVERMLIP